MPKKFVDDFIRLNAKLLGEGIDVTEFPTSIKEVEGPRIEEVTLCSQVNAFISNSAIQNFEEIKLTKGAVFLRPIAAVIQQIILDAEFGPNLHFKYECNERNEFWGASHMRNASNAMKTIHKGKSSSKTLKTSNL